jgi:hypothetical protein
MTELSVNAAKFLFFRRLLFLSHIKRDSAEIHQIFLNFLKINVIQVIGHL